MGIFAKPRPYALIRYILEDKFIMTGSEMSSAHSFNDVSEKEARMLPTRFDPGAVSLDSIFFGEN